MHTFISWLLFLIFSFHLTWSAEPDSNRTGSLIVTFQTGPKAERLHRVHFWLKTEGQEPQFYPKGNASVDDPSELSRMVVIEHLHPGQYTLEFAIPNADDLFEEVPKKEVAILPGKIVKIDQAIKPRYASLKASAVFEDGEASGHHATLTLKDHLRQIRAQSTVGKFNVRHICPGNYLLVFEKVPGYKNPEPLEITFGPNETLGPIEGLYTKISKDVAMSDPPPFPILQPDMNHPLFQKTVFVPEGKVLMGDPFDKIPENERSPRIVKVSGFQIGMYQVTNSQYAQWLNKALKEKKVIYLSEGEHKGLIIDQEGRLLFKTAEFDPYSQIIVQANDGKTLLLPALGKHNHPVVHVSWYGAALFCHDNQLRLPTEAEWEKAAGMAKTQPGQPLVKYRYGFSKNEIDKTWANYKDTDRPIEAFEVKTSRVGFYNGTNTLPSKDPGGTQGTPTHLAVSPTGAFDMSGNVWEWVSDWYDSRYPEHFDPENPQGPHSGRDKVAKGGCYDSLPDGVRTAERIALLPDHTDPFTGFRVAADKQ